MQPDNFDLHISGNYLSYYHKDLMELINSVTEEEKSELEEFADEISERLFDKGNRKVKLIWGYKLEDKYIENILGHVLCGDRQDFDLYPIDLDKGHLKYIEHNIGNNDNLRAASFSILLRYISILSKHAIE